MLSLLNLFSGPLGGIVEKFILAGVTFAMGKGWLSGDAGTIAGAIYTIFSGIYTGVTRSDTAKIQAINAGDNGVKVVPVATPGTAVNVPLPGRTD